MHACKLKMYVKKPGPGRQNNSNRASLSKSERLCDGGSENTEGHFAKLWQEVSQALIMTDTDLSC